MRCTRLHDKCSGAISLSPRLAPFSSSSSSAFSSTTGASPGATSPLRSRPEPSTTLRRFRFPRSAATLREPASNGTRKYAVQSILCDSTRICVSPECVCVCAWRHLYRGETQTRIGKGWDCVISLSSPTRFAYRFVLSISRRLPASIFAAIFIANFLARNIYIYEILYLLHWHKLLHI